MCNSQKHTYEEEEQPAALSDRIRILSVAIETDRIVEAEEQAHSRQSVPRELDEDVRQHERLPGVRLGRALTDLVQVALGNEVRHGLVDERAEDDEQHEHGEHLVLQILDRATGLEEREADEESADDDESELGDQVCWVVPVPVDITT